MKDLMEGNLNRKKLIKAKKKGAITTQRGRGRASSIGIERKKGEGGARKEAIPARRSQNQSSREEENQRHLASKK